MSERTLVLLKPDCVQRRLMGRVISRLEDKGLTIIALKMLRLTSEQVQRHYAEHLQQPFFPALEKFLTAAPVVVLIVEGPEVIRVLREMVGVTNGLRAPGGTIRGDFSSSQRLNVVHASDSPESAQREIDLYFAPDELCPYTPALAPWTCEAGGPFG